MTLFHRGVVLALLAACADAPESDGAADLLAGEEQAAPPLPTDPPIPLATGDLQDRWVYDVGAPGLPCPAPTGDYSVSKLFGPGAPGQLGRFCQYEAKVVGGGGACPLSAVACGQDNPLPDLMVVGPAGISAKAVIGEKLRQRFVQQMGSVPSVLPSTTGHTPTRVALFDGSPDHGPQDALSSYATLATLHGYNLANILNTQPKDSTGTALFEPYTNLALQLETNGLGQVVSDPTHGGSFGSISYLAAAVVQEVGLWKPSRGQRGLVLNLSIGWDPEWGGDLADRPVWPPAIEALYRALQYAKCEGALTFAAAGNKLGGPTTDTDPLFPAGWGKGVFDPTLCAADYSVTGVPVLHLLDTPLVYAVGGVDHENRALVVSRPNSQPEHVAFGDHGAVTDVFGNLTDPMTGTSVSTAVVSSAAAAVWANRPNLTSTAVAGALLASGSTIGVVDPFWCSGGTCDDVRRVDVCRAVSYACDAASPGYAATSPGGVGQPCDRSPTAGACGPLTPAVSIVPPGPLLAQMNAFAPDIAIVPYPLIYNAPECGLSRNLRQQTAGMAMNPCPDTQYYEDSAEPWLHPQPRTSECPSCFVELPTGIVTLDWNNSGGGSFSVDSLSISITNGAGVVTTFTAPSNYVLTGPVQLTLPAALLTGTVKASISGRASDTTYTAPLSILR